MLLAHWLCIVRIFRFSEHSIENVGFIFGGFCKELDLNGHKQQICQGTDDVCGEIVCL